MQRKVENEKVKNNTGQVRPLKKVTSKLIALGLTAIITTVVLGFTGIHMLNKTNSNNRVLENINKIKLLQNDNNTAEISFLYSLKDSYNDQILKNLDQLKETALKAKKHSGFFYKKKLGTIATNSETLKSNMQKLIKQEKERSFSAKSGLYAQFAGEDDALNEQFGKLAEDTEWVDGKWTYLSKESVSSAKKDGKGWKVYQINSAIPKMGKRNYLVLRLGGNGVKYSGKVHITNIKLDGKQDVDLSKLKVEDLSKSYGEAYSDLAIDDFAGAKSITYNASFDDSTDLWQEASIEIPIADYDIQNCKNVQFQVYLEQKEMKKMQVAAAYKEKFDFVTALETLEQKFSDYSMQVAEGNSAQDQLKEIQSTLDTLKKNIQLYSKDKDIISKVSASLDKKNTTLAAIQKLDNQIVSLKADNTKLNKRLSKLATQVGTAIEKKAEAAKTRTVILIVAVFLIGVLIVIALTLFVIASVRQSIHNFKGTLKLISEGDMTAKAKTGAGDEFDEFGQSLNQVSGKLTNVLGSVVEATEEIKNSGADLKTVAGRTGTTSEKIESSITEIAQGANEQAKDVESSTQETVHLGELVEEMVRNIEDLDNTSENMNVAGTEAIQILSELSESNTRMTQGVHRISQQIDTTNKAVEKIKESVSLISSIASQTNLLSLNASIEAARAGEAGKGFAVVATEIQQLADQSNESANTIYQVISVLTREFGQTKEVMEEVENASAQQNEKLAQTQKHFDSVSSGIRLSREKTAQFKESVQECDEVRKNVSKLMLNLSAISEENAASTTETAESMQALNEAITELLNSSEKLITISNELEENMNFFKLEETVDEAEDTKE